MNLIESRSCLLEFSKVVLNSVSIFRGSYCGDPTCEEKFTNIGTLIPERSEKNLPNSTFPDTSIKTSSSRLRSLTLRSIEPNPMVLLLPEIVISAKSASFAFILAVAPHPPPSSKSVSLNSLYQICADLSNPSSSRGFATFFKGLRTPSMYTRTLLKSGCPFTVMIFTPS